MTIQPTALDRLVPKPDLVEIDVVDLPAPVSQVWDRLRHGTLGETGPTRVLFALRTLADRRGTAGSGGGLRLDDMHSAPTAPGFQVLADDPPHEVVAGAIGKVWRLRIPFVHVPDADAFAAFAEPDFIKVAWGLRVTPVESRGTHDELEVRVAATSDDALRRFRRYFRVIGPGSRYIRRALLRSLTRDVEVAAAGAR
jgi:hypothetical protein